MSDPLSLEPKNGDYVEYINALQAGKIKSLEGIAPPAAPAPERRTLGGDEGVGVRDLIGAFRRKVGVPAPADAARTAAIERMERASSPAAPAPQRQKRVRIDPGARFAASAFGLFGLMGLLVGLDSGEPPVMMFGAFAVFISILMHVKLWQQSRR